MPVLLPEYGPDKEYLLLQYSKKDTLGIEIGLFELVENSFGPFLCRGRRKSKSHSKKFT